MIIDAAKKYIDDVASGDFPNDSESFKLSDEELLKLENYKQC